MKEPSELPQTDPHVNVAASSSLSRRDRATSRPFLRFFIAACLGFAIYWFVSGSYVPAINHVKCHFRGHGLTHGIATGDDCDVPTTAVDGSAVPLAQRPNERHELAFKNSSSKVPLEAHIMSKCPDARDCLRQLVVPAMEQINGLVDFDLSFIASVSNRTSEIICKHGPSECIGNALILCAINLPYPHQKDLAPSRSTQPRTPTIRSLGFANCLINSYERIPERGFIEHCAMEHGIDFDALNHCASQQEDDPGENHQDPPLSGIALLRRSALHSEKLGIATSCTVRLDDSVWCVRDGGVWKDCAKGGQGSNVTVLVDEVKKLWKKRNH